MRRLLLLFVIVVSGCAPAADTGGAAARRIVYGLTLSVSGIDPHINQNTELGIVLRSVYDTLVYRDPVTKAIVPGLASAWTISDDGLVYTFNLRQDVMFHDGTFFNADAVAANLQRIMNPETGSQKARLLLGSLASYQIIDQYTISLTLSAPYSPLLDGLAQVYTGIASPAALGQYNLLRYQYHQVGTGPFQFVEYIPENRIVIRRNPNYAWGPAFYAPPGANAVQEIEFRFYRDPATRAAALESGEAQVMGELLPADARALANNAAFRVLPVTVPGQPLQFYLNTRLAPLDNLAVRQALLYATNRGAIVESVYQGFSPVAWGPVASSALFYNPGVVNAYAYNIEQTRALLNAAGYADNDRDGILEREGLPLEIRVIQPAWGLVPEVTQLLQDQWRAAGIRAIIDPVPGFTALLEKVTAGEYHLVSFDTSGIDPSFLNARFMSDGAVNWTGYASAPLDELLRAAAQLTDPAARQPLYSQAQSLIMQEALILPIREYVNLNAHSARVQNLLFDPYGWFPLLHNVTLAE
ncbi:MAG: ABC transporter substrate-binding protein [Anaerolineae bacterium]|jgi:peptide/nickel transport system substrate-binding protein|nr:ABC transporter substrate-binding protein [Anaerolineae bacterium]